MNNILTFIKKKSAILAFILIAISVFQGLILRRIDYAHVPEPYVILDEHTNIWHGLSLRETGIPTAWSILSAYKTDSAKFGSGGGIKGFNLEVNGKTPTLLNYRKVKSPVTAVFGMDLGMGYGARYIPLVQPYLDHPPFGALVLSMGVLGKVTTFSDLSILDMRRASVYLAVITQILIAILAFQLTKKYFVAIVASFAYATVPSFLLLSRYAQLENVLTPLMLASLILLMYINEKKGEVTKKILPYLLIVSGIFAGLAALTKLSGWISIVLGLFLLWRWKFGSKNLLYFGAPAVLLGIFYFLWGLYLSPRLFLDLIFYQGISRGFIGSINLLVTMFRVGILNFPFDGWWVGGFLSFLFLPKDNKLLPLYASIVLVLFSALVLVGANYTWYFIPLIPFMCISIAMFFDRVMTRPDFMNIMIMFFVFISSSVYWGYGVIFASFARNNYSQPFTLYRIMFFIFLAIALFLPWLKRKVSFKKIWTVSIFVLLIVLVLLNHQGIYYIVNNWGKLPSLYTPGTF